MDRERHAAGLHALTLGICLLELAGADDAVQITEILTTDRTCRRILDQVKRKIKARENANGKK